MGFKNNNNKRNNKASEYSLWKATKYLKRPNTYNPPLFNSKINKWAKSDKQKAELFANHLENVFKPNSLPKAKKEDISIELNQEELLEKEKTIPHFSFGEVSKMILKGKNKKAPGQDQITGFLLKQLPNKAIHKIVEIFNAMLELEHIPIHFKEAVIILFHKSGKPSKLPSSYRPISLLSSIAKLFEILYLPRLLKVIDAKKIIPDQQFGFRKKHSTLEQLHRVTNFIEKALENGHYCAAAFLDVAQAFDKVSHKLLIQMLAKLIPKCHVNLLKSYLEGRFFKVRVGEDLSVPKPILAGVPQGSALGPMQYLLFKSDIPQQVRN